MQFCQAAFAVALGVEPTSFAARGRLPRYLRNRGRFEMLILEGKSSPRVSITPERHERPAQHPATGTLCPALPARSSALLPFRFLSTGPGATRRQYAANGDIALHVLRNRSGPAGVRSAKVRQRCSGKVVQEFGPLGYVWEVPRDARAGPRYATMLTHHGNSVQGHARTEEYYTSRQGDFKRKGGRSWVGGRGSDYRN
jgi:hypothetical protein